MMDFTLTRSDLLILATGAVVAAGCALLGTFLVLRRMALVGDAISHAILPGIAIGFMLTHSRHSFVMLIGAAIAGLVTVWLVEMLYRTRRLYEDTAIAVVFPALFALGVLIVSRYRHVDLDLDCVIFGAIENAQLASLWLPAATLLLNVLFIGVLYRPLKLCTFDATFGHAVGFSPLLLHYLLMSNVSLTTVAGFEAVGAILVVALLIAPPATAYLLTDRLSRMLVLSVGFALLATVSGFYLARLLDSSISGAIAAMTGFFFGVVWLAAPRYGLLATLLRRWRLRRQFAADLLLLHLRDVSSVFEVDALARERLRWSPAFANQLLGQLEGRGLIVRQNDTLAITPIGREMVAQIETSR